MHDLSTPTGFGPWTRAQWSTRDLPVVHRQGPTPFVLVRVSQTVERFDVSLRLGDFDANLSLHRRGRWRDASLSAAQLFVDSLVVGLLVNLDSGPVEVVRKGTAVGPSALLAEAGPSVLRPRLLDLPRLVEAHKGTTRLEDRVAALEAEVLRSRCEAPPRARCGACLGDDFTKPCATPIEDALAGECEKQDCPWQRPDGWYLTPWQVWTGNPWTPDPQRQDAFVVPGQRVRFWRRPEEAISSLAARVGDHLDLPGRVEAVWWTPRGFATTWTCHDQCAGETWADARLTELRGAARPPRLPRHAAPAEEVSPPASEPTPEAEPATEGP